ncbi:MAG TPA: hypothetical protein VG871_10150 [Vicinamibacterales bacterium]|nr:hypothetical protein [Vicinamibacterales bacterium]
MICAFPNYRVDLAITSWDDAWMPIVPYRGPKRRASAIQQIKINQDPSSCD